MAQRCALSAGIISDSLLIQSDTIRAWRMAACATAHSTLNIEQADVLHDYRIASIVWRSGPGSLGTIPVYGRMSAIL